MTFARGFSLFLLPLVLASCTPTVQFTEPMPPSRPNLPNIPKAYRGVIHHSGFLDDAVWQIGKDTIRVGDEVMVNGQDFLLRRMAGHVVLSMPVEETGHYEVIVLHDDGERLYPGEFKDGDPFVRRMGTLLTTPPQPLRTPGTAGRKYVLLAPTAKEFRTILKEGLYEDLEGCPLPKGGVVRP